MAAVTWNWFTSIPAPGVTTGEQLELNIFLCRTSHDIQPPHSYAWRSCSGPARLKRSWQAAAHCRESPSRTSSLVASRGLATSATCLARYPKGHVCRCICLPTYLPTKLAGMASTVHIYRWIHLPVHRFLHPVYHLPYLPIYLSTYLPIYRSICLTTFNAHLNLRCVRCAFTSFTI